MINQKRMLSSGLIGRPAVQITLLVLVMLLSACAATNTASSAKDPIPERVQARWNALLAEDFETAYSFYSPGYRSANSLTDFELSIRLRKVQWQSAEYLEHSCEESLCTAKIKMGYRVASPVPGINEWKSHSVIDEKWIKSDGQWWYLPNSR
jgi:hypothetical protein